MGENDGVDVLRREPEMAVSIEAFLASALEEAAVEKDTGPADLDDVAAPGHTARGAMNFDPASQFSGALAPGPSQSNSYRGLSGEVFR